MPQIIVLINSATEKEDLPEIGRSLMSRHWGKSFSFLTTTRREDAQKMQLLREAMGLEEGIFRHGKLYHAKPNAEEIMAAANALVGKELKGELAIVLVGGEFARPQKMLLAATKMLLKDRQEIFPQHRKRFGGAREMAVTPGDALEVGVFKGTSICHRIKSRRQPKKEKTPTAK